MNATATTEIRELTAQELDQVTGARVFTGGETPGELAAVAAICTYICTVAVGCLLEWLFG
jgi:hypothetical protein